MSINLIGRQDSYIYHNLDKGNNTLVDDVYISQKLANEIKDARVLCDFTQSEVANELCVRVEVIRSYENGTATPKRRFIERLERFFNTNFTLYK